MNCPSKAITHKSRIVNGRQFYKFNENLCYEMWVKSGTDCGTCIQSCPFTQGVDLEKARKMKDHPELMDEIMKEHFEKHGRRRYTKNELDIVKCGDIIEKRN
jgi:epoxyqueuosine reductase QueG